MGRWIRGQLPPRLEDQSSDSSAPQLVSSNRGPVCSSSAVLQRAASIARQGYVTMICSKYSNEAGVLRRV
jgi:hypothetical protein